MGAQLNPEVEIEVLDLDVEPTCPQLRQLKVEDPQDSVLLGRESRTNLKQSDLQAVAAAFNEEVDA